MNDESKILVEWDTLPEGMKARLRKTHENNFIKSEISLQYTELLIADIKDKQKFFMADLVLKAMIAVGVTVIAGALI